MRAAFEFNRFTTFYEDLYAEAPNVAYFVKYALCTPDVAAAMYRMMSPK